MMKLLNKLFINEKFILAIILLNSGIIYAQVSGYNNLYINIIDISCTIIFSIEMICKHIKYGVKGYWKDGWNQFDGILVFISLPSLIEFFIPVEMLNVSLLLILRLLRILRFFRLLHFFPNFSKLVVAFKVAIRESYAILLSFFTIVFIFGLINCSLFKEADPGHFETPLRSIFSVFQICTLEGWYEIPNTVAEYYGHSSVVAEFVRVYFCFILILGGIIGMSFINSIFVDAMVADNNDEVKLKLDEIGEKVSKLLENMDKKK